ncbi:hypothetical protein KIN20_008959 [Parelaphostrongylus tenuis]|uniref:DH domain-containing protein n=1 Tax=Parelaphostrongylus tenuis TaxID=148309 RepID=A0AAD5QHW5_PARTN|nr:hypothetical protein KIN20_008959 [Parelaphostrongylus tenuis]
MPNQIIFQLQKTWTHTSLDSTQATSNLKESETQLEIEQPCGDDEARKTFMICQEMHLTEMHYAEKLRLLILVRDALLARFAEKRPILREHEIVTAFGKVAPILDIHERICERLKGVVDNGMETRIVHAK